METSNQQRLVRVFEAVFPDLPPASIPTATQETVKTWDSVAAITLLNLIEEEWEMEVDFADVAELTSFAKILAYLNQRAVEPA
jgi:acyl carrier protein